MGIQTIKGAEKKTYKRDQELTKTVMNIIDDVRTHGEAALIAYAEKFDHVKIAGVKVDSSAVTEAYKQVPPETVQHIRFAAGRIRDFAKKQLDCIKPLHYTSDIPGVELGHRLVPVEKCGCYIPSGRYPLPSTALMSVAVAKVAGVKYAAACSPPVAGHGTIHPAVLVAMDIAGADEIFCMGGAQAIAAYAYGAGAVPKMDLIVGPGNRFVTEAKRQVLGDVGIDSLAGPSEVLIIADETANPVHIAIDLLAQAEHDPAAKPILVCTDRGIIEKSLAELERLLKDLPTRDVAIQSWTDNGSVFFADRIDDAVALSNELAPEHVEVQVDPRIERDVADSLLHYGSLFVGHYAPVAFGDFVSGTNHTLPTMSTARYSNGVWVGTFIKVPFHQFVSREGCGRLSVPAMHFAETEGLYAHRDSVRFRVEEGK
ncbi:histidinol dehydrogenase [Treponema primitia]|uniref:histidinol dehydrogenase n=1 Tax=Treponema primitia TaxID=88058 RepID=UPI0002554C45|nr:histidinol dehydrogenase [Treponema primitia]